MMQSPMLSAPLKQTNEIDWVQPLKEHIGNAYAEDPERYAEECSTLNRLRQDMRGAGKDSVAGRDLLYRYYGQLELLDLRFPVDENHIKISFTWFDAFTEKPTSQYSLAYEKASVIFNISAALSCHAAFQDRNEEMGQKAAYHSFQASAGMFTYINENFLHAPSMDLSRETVKILINVMLAQAQEVFVEKQIIDGRKLGLLAKLAGQAALLYAQAAEGIQENAMKTIFDKHWLHVTQIKTNYLSSVAQYYQAMADDDANSHGTAIARLQIAERECKDAGRIAHAFPNTVSSNSNLGLETKSNLVEMTTRHLTNIIERLTVFNKDNDFIYHQTIPASASLNVIPKLAAAKAIPVSELYQGQDIQRIIGPDIFHKIVPISVTESASLYDEEKAKLVRAEAEGVEIANDEMSSSLDYLKLPESLIVVKGGLVPDIKVDDEFRSWCEELAGHEPYEFAFDALHKARDLIMHILGFCSKLLDQEEGTCEKMRTKYEDKWTQQPSSRLTTTLMSDIKNYRDAVDEASNSDANLVNTSRRYDSDFDEMRSAGETNEADVLYMRAIAKAAVGSPSSTDQQISLLDESFDESECNLNFDIAKVEELLRKLQLIKRERSQVMRDLKEKVHSDDISSTLILSKKATSHHESQLFQVELNKYRPYQQRLLQTRHKQSALMRELTKIYSAVLQDKRVKGGQIKYNAANRQRLAVAVKYKRIHRAFKDLHDGIMSARNFYSGMRLTVESLQQNVKTFVENRRVEGAQLLAQIERDKLNDAGSQADQERDRLKDLMQRMSMSSSTAGSSKQTAVVPRSPRLNSARGWLPSIPPSPSFRQTNEVPSDDKYSNSSISNDQGSDLQGLNPYATSPPTAEIYTAPKVAHLDPVSVNIEGTRLDSLPAQSNIPSGYFAPPPPPGIPLSPRSQPDASDYADPSKRGGHDPYKPTPRASGSKANQSQDHLWAGLGPWK